MIDNIFSSKSNNSDLFLNSQSESIYDQLYSKDSNELFEEEIKSFSYTSFLDLLKEINERVKENLQKNNTQPTSKKINFVVNNIGKKTKRGRQNSKNSKKGIHADTRFDNLIRKIQVHFFSFVIAFCNDAYKKVFKYSNKSFKNINYENKTTVNFDYTYGLRNLCIKDLLKMKISKKYTRYKDFYNEKLLEEIEYSSQWLDRLFQMNYLKLFNYYYNNKGKPLDKIVFENEEIILSKQTKPFYFLLEKYKSLRPHLINTVESVYFEGKENYENPFTIEK